jgi:uncharacterized membrane protein
MYNYNQNNYSAPTTLGIPERWERVLCYVGGWLTGIIFLLIEQRNQTVRRHAAQSTLIFGVLGILGLIVQVLGAGLGGVLVIGGVIGTVGWLLGLVGFAAWVGLMVLAYFSAKTLFTGPRWERFL